MVKQTDILEILIGRESPENLGTSLPGMVRTFEPRGRAEGRDNLHEM